MILKISQLSKSHGQSPTARLAVIRNLDLSVKQADTVAITGHSGSGKTTLLSLMAGLDTPDAGSVRVAGEDISAMDEDILARFRARNIGIIFQQFHLMPHLTARENICLPLEILRTRGIAARVDQILEQVGLTQRQHHLPGQLSGGECQRVAIARALVTRPTLLLADEPTGNLDTDTGKQVADLLFELVISTGMTLVVVTHNSALANRCHRQLKLVQGQLI